MAHIETYQEQLLLEKGYDAFTTEEKNHLISVLANREGLSYAEITKDYILGHHKKLKNELLSEICEDLVLEGFTASNGHKYRTNRDDQLNMLATRVELQYDETENPVYWKTEDVGYLPHTKAEWLKMYQEAFDYKKAMLFKYNSLKAAIHTATTHAGLINITWDEHLDAPEPDPVIAEPAPTEPVTP